MGDDAVVTCAGKWCLVPVIVDPHGETTGEEFPSQSVDLIPVVGVGALQLISPRVMGRTFEQTRLEMEEAHELPAGLKRRVIVGTEAPERHGTFLPGEAK